jgi:hypothetical protein
VSTHGKWIASHSEEHWSDPSEFDTREEALAYALHEIAAAYEVRHVYTGQIDKITAEDLSCVLDGSRVVEDADEWLYDNVGDEVDHTLPCTRTQEDDLTTRLRAAFAEWMEAHGIESRCYRIEHVKSHEVPEADESAVSP